MPRLALVLSGAVSLGSFEAGALDEILFVLQKLAEDPGVDDPWVLDVITGASAGSMTAGLVARAVMHDFGHRRFLRQAWVEDIDIADLLTGPPANAFLSKEPIDRIADRYLTVEEDEAVRPAAFAPEKLSLSFTLSNMSGVDWELPVRHAQADRFTSTFFGDRREFRLTREASSDRRTSEELEAVRDEWSRIREAGIASGNFPFAFRPARVFNDELMYRGSVTDLPDEGFAFVDGGMFNNEPLRAAIGLAREIDGGQVDPERVFLLVDPNLNRSSHDAAFGDEASMSATALRLLGALRGESSANDWLAAVRKNNEIAWRDLLLDRIADLVRDQELSEPEAFLADLEEAGEAVVEEKRRLFGKGRYPPDYLQTAYRRTERARASRLNDLTPGRRAILVRVLFLLNSAAGLDKKFPLNIDVIYATKGETAGERLASFGGFFEREWREHDYRVGRRKTHELLPEILGLDGEPPKESPEDLYDPPEDYSRVTMEDADRKQRERLRNHAVERARGLLAEHFGWNWKMKAAWKFYLRGKVEGKVNEVLEL